MFDVEKHPIRVGLLWAFFMCAVMIPYKLFSGDLEVSASRLIFGYIALAVPAGIIFGYSQRFFERRKQKQ
ncbi:hypothetical protein [Parasphingorhabdus cellanae]|uniref:Transmembrane protein n=1 Tax=Parasphingorhabdus cellanae TaxID=2806553 RepID=A0ABX7T5L7_9SPHN|nr:hypothetical protein [Parasphingorhabdus cellanae]QTD56062.1 hypothetical protein J4G78_00145 [Parasphingorhabdus cellanae]